MKAAMSASTIGASRLGQSANGSGANALEAINAQKRMMEYDSVVKSLNARRKEKKPFPIVSHMKEKVNSEKIPDLSGTYTLLAELLNEKPDGSAPGERTYARGYMAEDSSRERCEVLTKLVANGTNWLEKIFANHVTKTLADNAKEIPVGGVPGFRSKVSAYVGYKFKSHPIANQLEVSLEQHLVHKKDSSGLTFLLCSENRQLVLLG
jgi:hypothetical protein